MRLVTALLLCPVALLLGQTPPSPPTAPHAPQMAPAMPEVPPDRVVLTVGDLKITAEMFNQIVDILPPQVQAAARGPNRRQYADTLVKIFSLAQEAKRRKLDEAPAFKIQSTFQQSNLLAGKVFEQLNKESTLSDADLHKYYDEHQAEFEQVKARHILIRMKGSPVPQKAGQPDLTEEEALAKVQALQKRIAAGEDFAMVAEKESDDTSSGSNGGLLGTFRRNTMVPAFEDAAFKLKPGEVSEPIKTQFGYHLIKVDSKENSFEDAKPDLERKLKPEMAQKAVAELEKKANPVYDPEFFGPPAPTTAKQ